MPSSVCLSIGPAVYGVWGDLEYLLTVTMYMEQSVSMYKYKNLLVCLPKSIQIYLRDILMIARSRHRTSLKQISFPK